MLDSCNPDLLTRLGQGIRGQGPILTGALIEDALASQLVVST